MKRQFRRYSPFGVEEVRAATRVVRSGQLSNFVGEWGADFYGGVEVRNFEEEWSNFFGVKNSIAVNSWTSGLIASLGALDIEPGDEVILPPWTMSACAAAVLHWNAIPVFADILPDTFCIDPQAVEGLVSSRTKAVMAVDIFGHPADIIGLRDVTERNGLLLISDTAQSPGARIDQAYCGVQADIGGFSLNHHKHIHTGEGGMIVTNDDYLAEKCKMIRNHAEAVVAQRPDFPLTNMVGYNFRLGEIEAAIGRVQLRRLEEAVRSRQQIAAYLTAGLSDLPGLLPPVVREGCTHAYYMYAMQVDQAVVGKKDKLVEQLQSLGVPGLSTQYANLHLLPMFQRRIAFGTQGYPWTLSSGSTIDYRKGICPVAEKLQDETYVGLSICEYDFTPEDLDFIIEAFHCAWKSMQL